MKTICLRIRTRAQYLAAAALLFCGSAFASSVTLSDKINFLITQRSVVKIIDGLNESNLQQAVDCLQNTKSSASFKNIRSQGDLNIQKFDCDIFLNRYFFDGLTDRWSEMRRDLILSSTTFPTDTPLIAARNLERDAAFQIQFNPVHPVTNFLSRWMIPVAKVEPLKRESSEFKEILIGLSKQYQDICEDYFTQPSTTLRLKRFSSVVAQEQFCITMLREPNSNLDNQDVRNLVRMNEQNFSIFLQSQLRKFREEKRQAYYEALNSRQYLLMMSTPSSPILEPLIFILENAKARKKTNEIYDFKNNIASEIKSFSAGLSSAAQRQNLYQDLSIYADAQYAFLYTGKIFEATERKNVLLAPLNLVREAVKKDIEWDHMKDRMAEDALVLAVNVGCLALKRATLFFGCLVAVSTPLNVWLVQSSINDYGTYLNDLLSVLESQHKLSSMADADSHFAGTLFSVVTSVGGITLDGASAVGRLGEILRSLKTETYAVHAY